MAIDYKLMDNPNQNRVELTYENGTGRKVCISAGEWPNMRGKLNQASDLVFLKVNKRIFPIIDFNTGYCQGKCATTVRPREIITGFISYDDFNLPKELYKAKKELIYLPPASFCK